MDKIEKDKENSFDKIPLLLVFVFLLIIAYFVVLTLGKHQEYGEESSG